LHIEICGLQCNTADGPKTKQDGAIIFFRGPKSLPKYFGRAFFVPTRICSIAFHHQNVTSNLPVAGHFP
jgi:hypothetical protein